MIEPVYIGNGVFTLMPEYDETIEYSIEDGEFNKPAWDDSDIDYKSMFANAKFAEWLAKN